MTTIAWSIGFVVAATWCAERLVRAGRAVEAVVPIPLLVGSWVALLTVRSPTPGRALLAFGLADLAILAISTLGVMRLLGGFERAAPGHAGEDDDDAGDDGPPSLPCPVPRHPTGRRPVRRRPPRPDAGRRRPPERHGAAAGGSAGT